MQQTQMKIVTFRVDVGRTAGDCSTCEMRNWWHQMPFSLRNCGSPPTKYYFRSLDGQIVIDGIVLMYVYYLCVEIQYHSEKLGFSPPPRLSVFIFLGYCKCLPTVLTRKG